MRRGSRNAWRWWLVGLALTLVAPLWATGLQAQTPALGGWALASSGVDVDLYDVYFPSTDSGYAVGANHMILRTTDRGATWEPVGLRGTRRIWSVDALTDTHAFVVGDQGEIMWTTNGRDWQVASTTAQQNLYALSVVPSADAATAIRYGITVGERADAWEPVDAAGRNWTSFILIPPTSRLSKPALYGVSMQHVGAGAVVGDRAIYFRTRDGNWHPIDQSEVFYGVDLVDNETGWAVGTNGTILKTADGGQSWTPQTSGTSATLYAVDFVDTQRGWAVGAGGTIVATTDGGQTWQSQPSGTSADLRSVSFPAADEGWAVGQGGVMVRTTTGGRPATTPTPGATPTPAPGATPTPGAPAATPTPVVPGTPTRIYLPLVFRAFAP